MFTIEDYIIPKTLDDAYKVLTENRNNTVLAGCTFLRLGSKKVKIGIDLSRLELDYIEEKEQYIEIGAMTTLREIEVSEILNSNFSGILPKSVKNIVGVQFRNIATVGANVYSKFCFGDITNALLALNAEVFLFQGGRISLKKFLTYENCRDILIKIIIPRREIKASYQSIRNSYSDYSILNVAVSKGRDGWTIAVGARPGIPQVALNSSVFLNKSSLKDEDILYSSKLATEELKFGSNMIGSEEYRKNICEVLVRRAIQEVLSCK